MPVSIASVSLISSVQVPLGLMPINCPSESCGRNEPVNGALPARMLVAALSSKVVFE